MSLTFTARCEAGHEALWAQSRNEAVVPGSFTVGCPTCEQDPDMAVSLAVNLLRHGAAPADALAVLQVAV